MTGLLKLYVKAIRTLEENSYRQRNSIYEQIMKRINKENTSLQDNHLLLEVEWTDKTCKQRNQEIF